MNQFKRTRALKGTISICLNMLQSVLQSTVGRWAVGIISMVLVIMITFRFYLIPALQFLHTIWAMVFIELGQAFVGIQIDQMFEIFLYLDQLLTPLLP